MAGRCLGSVLKPFSSSSFELCLFQKRLIHISPVLFTVKAGKVKVSINKDKPVTYEDAFSPPHIAHRKSWNSWNTSTIEGGMKPADTAIDDIFIRKFIYGTFPNYVLSKVIIKRQYNNIRIAFIMDTLASQRRLYFLVGYTETILSYWFHCNVKLEIQTVNTPEKLIFKYV